MSQLSEHERRQFWLLADQIRAEDPTFVKTMRTTRSLSPWHRPAERNKRLATLGFIFGIIALFVGLIVPNIVVASIVGLLAFSISMYFGIRSFILAEEPTSSSKVRRRNFMANLEAKWTERKRDNF